MQIIILPGGDLGIFVGNDTRAIARYQRALLLVETGVLRILRVTKWHDLVLVWLRFVEAGIPYDRADVADLREPLKTP